MEARVQRTGELVAGLGLAAALVLASGCGSDPTGAGVVDGGVGSVPSAGSAGQAAGSAAPAADAGACEAPSGFYDASFTLQSGDCGPLDEVTFVDVSAGVAGVATSIQRRVNDRIETEIVLRGCRLRLSRTTVRQDDVPKDVLEGETLTIHADGRITGVVTFTRFDDAGAAACSGTYELVLSQNRTSIGASAGGAMDAGTSAAESLDPALLAEVRDDCTQTVMCRAQMAETLEDDPINGCVEATARLLAGDDARQAMFVANRARCQGLVVCNYYSCAIAR